MKHVSCIVRIIQGIVFDDYCVGKVESNCY